MSSSPRVEISEAGGVAWEGCVAISASSSALSTPINTVPAVVVVTGNLSNLISVRTSSKVKKRRSQLNKNENRPLPHVSRVEAGCPWLRKCLLEGSAALRAPSHDLIPLLLKAVLDKAFV